MSCRWPWWHRPTPSRLLPAQSLQPTRWRLRPGHGQAMLATDVDKKAARSQMEHGTGYITTNTEAVPKNHRETHRKMEVYHLVMTFTVRHGKIHHFLRTVNHLSSMGHRKTMAMLVITRGYAAEHGPCCPWKALWNLWRLPTPCLFGKIHENPQTLLMYCV